MANVKGKLDESNKSSKDKDKLSGITSAFATLLADTNNINRTSKALFILVASLLAQTAPAILVEIANTLINSLNSISLVYQLIGYNPILTTNELYTKDAYTFAIEGISRYNSHHFYRVIINTGTSKYLTTRLGQF